MAVVMLTTSLLADSGDEIVVAPGKHEVALQVLAADGIATLTPDEAQALGEALTSEAWKARARSTAPALYTYEEPAAETPVTEPASADPIFTPEEVAPVDAASSESTV